MVEENIGEKTDNHGHGKDLMKFFSRFFLFCGMMIGGDDFSTLASNLWQIALHLVAMIGGRGCNMLKGVARWFEKLELIFEEA